MNTKCRRARFVSAAATFLLAALVIPSIGRADLYVLRTLSGAASYQMAINGLVTGVTDLGDAYSFDGTNLVDYGIGPFGTYFSGQGVNMAGHVVGFGQSGDWVQAIYATSSSNSFGVGDPLGGHNSFFFGVSDRINGLNQGDICGVGSDPTDVTYHCIGYDSATNIYTGMPEPDGTTNSYGQKVTSLGGIVGYLYGTSTPGGINGFYWDQDTATVLTSGTLSGGTYSYIFGMDIGNTIACGAADDNTGAQHAVTWNLSALTPLPLGNPTVTDVDQAFGIRKDGRAVGQTENAAGNAAVAALWDGASVEDLNTVTVNPNGSAPTVTMYLAQNINEAGQIVCNAFETSSHDNAIARLDPFGPTAIMITGKPKHGKPVKGTITLNMPSPIATTVTVQSGNTGALANFTVHVPQGASSVTFKSPKLSKKSKGQTLTLTVSDSGLTAVSNTFTIK